MMCDECGKVKASVHLTEIVNDQITKLNLCENCAREKGSNVEQHFGIADLLSALSDVETPTSQATSGVPQPPLIPVKNKCPQCGMGYEDFKKIGRLGCSECYQTFKTTLQPLLKRIHGATAHMGKSPSPVAVKEQKFVSKLQDELDAAKLELSKAIKKEEFEEAAALRDKVKFIEKKLKDSK